MEIEALEKQINALCQKRDALNEEIRALHAKLKTMRTEALNLDLEHITPEKYMSVRNIDQYNGSVYSALQDWLQNNYMSRGVYASGEVGYYGQRFLKLMFDQNRPFEEQLGIKDFLPYIDYDYLGIFDDTLSANGIYELHDIHAKPKLTKTVYGRIRDEKQFDTFDEALKYVYDRHPYEKRKAIDFSGFENEDYSKFDDGDY